MVETDSAALVQQIRRCWAPVDQLTLGEVRFLSRAQRRLEEGSPLNPVEIEELARIEKAYAEDPTPSEPSAMCRGES